VGASKLERRSQKHSDQKHNELRAIIGMDGGVHELRVVSIE
jgi:hypothetical protein